ncbi:hypothetical protein JHK87_022967 [Glycine soja]|nr:hypothetical protein JHK87_022967 [Glycine soja]
MPTSATSVGRNGSLDIYASSVDSHETHICFRVYIFDPRSNLDALSHSSLISLHPLSGEPLQSYAVALAPSTLSAKALCGEHDRPKYRNANLEGLVSLVLKKPLHDIMVFIVAISSNVMIYNLKEVE